MPVQPIDVSPAGTVSQAVRTRVSCRGYLPEEVPQDLLIDIFERARRAPSGGNLQPWSVHVLTGDKLRDFVAQGLERCEAGIFQEGDMLHYPDPRWGQRIEWRREAGYELYALMGIDRRDMVERKRVQLRNMEFFGAPAGMIITLDTRYVVAQYIDIGIYLQTVMLLLREAGLHSAPQGWWCRFPRLVAENLDVPETEVPVVGLAFGYADPEMQMNQLYTNRAERDELVKFY